PEWLAFAAPDSSDALAAEVLDRRFAGPVTFYRARTSSGAELLLQADAAAAAPGVKVGVRAVAPAIAYAPEAAHA
ncbi:MAG TPA: TOBE domain-containing protein, partial [Longimicrobiales bacterium]